MAWARAVKRRRRNPYPTLWLFTDERRLADPLPAIARLPCGIGGVVFRHDGAADRGAADRGAAGRGAVDRTALGRRIAKMCRARRLALVVAGDARLAAALGAGVHLRGGRWPGPARPRPTTAALRTASAHDPASLRRAAAAKPAIIFLSPVFETLSHPAGRPLGPERWSRLATLSPALVYALGGMTGGNAQRLGPACAGAGATFAGRKAI